MDASTEWVMAWTDLILDSAAMSEAAHEGDLEEVRFRACSIAIRAKRHGFKELSDRALDLVGRLNLGDDAPASDYAKPVGDILRQVDAISRNACES
jgi:hypothetical protein